MNKRNWIRNSATWILLTAIIMSIVAPAYFAPAYALPSPNQGAYIVTDLGALPNAPQMLWTVPPPLGPPAPLWIDGPLVTPTGVAVGVPWNIVVADSGPPPAVFVVPPAGPPVAIVGPWVNPSDVAIDALGRIIVTDLGPPPAVFVVPPAGPPAPIAGPWVNPTGVAVGPPWNIVVADAGAPAGPLPALYSINPAGAVAPILAGAPLVNPSDVAIDAAGNIIVTDLGPPPAVFVVPPVGPIAFIAGPWATPTGVAVDAVNNYVVADQAAATVYIVDFLAGVVVPIGGFVKPDDVATVSPLTCPAFPSPASGNAPLAVSFTASPSGGLLPYTFLWTFGDGGSNATQNPVHIYQNSGTYNWTLIASDSVGQQVSASGTITAKASLAELAGFTSLPTDNMTLIVGDIALNPHGSKPPGVNYQQGRDTTPLGFVSGMLTNPQPSIFDTNATWINATSGRPFASIPPDLIFSIGGPGINAVTYYYETTSTAADKAPVKFGYNSTHFYWTFTSNGTKVPGSELLQSSTAVPPGTSDVFVIQVLRDADGRLVVLMYGTRYTGTWAAAWWFKFVVYPNIASYTDAYYIVRWTDAASGAGSDYTPDLGDTYTILAQG